MIWDLKSVLLLAVVSLFISNEALAQETSVIGATYPIIENDALKAIKAKAKKTDWESLRKNHTNSWLKNQQTHLPFATKDIIRFHKPMHVLQREVADKDGKIIYPAGFEFNPLEFVKLPFRVVAISYEQLSWFKSKLNKTDRVLLTSGDVFKAREFLQHQVFLLDPATQNKFNVLKVPSFIKQKGFLLEIEEIKFIPNQEKISHE